MNFNDKMSLLVVYTSRQSTIKKAREKYGNITLQELEEHVPELLQEFYDEYKVGEEQ